jgi:hypothetical protein
MKLVAILIASILLVGAIVVTAWVEAEAGFRHEVISDSGNPKVLILYHPSRDAGFSDEISLALAQGFKDAGLAVDRDTMTSKTPTALGAYALITVVSNTYWAAPDWPTTRYLARIRLGGAKAIGVMCGAGSTGRSERKLREALERAGAVVVTTRSYWIFRPNDERRLDARNRDVAKDMARNLGLEVGRAIRGPRENQASGGSDRNVSSLPGKAVPLIPFADNG